MGSETRFAYLDSIRGIASAVVLFSHCWLLLPHAFRDAVGIRTATQSLDGAFWFMLWKLVQGRGAVIIFFTLSGFVLAHSLRQRPTGYAEFVIRRVFRIYPAFAVAILVSFGLHSVLGAGTHVLHQEWIDEILRQVPTVDQLTGHLLMFGTRPFILLDNPVWSLVHEMRISLLFPLLYLFAERFRTSAVFISLGLSLAAAACTYGLTGQVPSGFLEKSETASLLTTLYFIPFFVAGIMLAFERHRMVRALAAVPDRWAAVLVVVALVLLTKADGLATSVLSVSYDYLRALGAVIIIGLALSKQSFQPFLMRPLLLWLGRVSYSLYLIHVPIIYLAYWLFYPAIGLAGVTIVAVLCSFLIAELMVRLVEEPGIVVGRAVSRRWFRRRALASI